MISVDRSSHPAQRLGSFLAPFSILAVSHGLQSWIRRQIVDDDPWDVPDCASGSSAPATAESSQDKVA